MAIPASGEVSYSRTKEPPAPIAERRGLGSIRARKFGARSLFEPNVKRILEKHDIRSKKTTLKLGNRHYRPDFLLLEYNTIIEATGVNTDSYWKRNTRKTRDYLHHKYRSIAVVPNGQVYESAKKRFNRKVKILIPWRPTRNVFSCSGCL